MLVKFSRHARRRAQLYKLSEAEIEESLLAMQLRKGENELIINLPGCKYPVKIVISVSDDVATVITNYPLKKGRVR